MCKHFVWTWKRSVIEKKKRNSFSCERKSKVRIVFLWWVFKTEDEASISELLESGHCLLPLLYDIILRFCLWPIAITADIKQAFLQISVVKEHQNFLCFFVVRQCFWYPSIIVYRSSRVIFSLNSSLFLFCHSKFISQNYCINRYMKILY